MTACNAYMHFCSIQPQHRAYLTQVQKTVETSGIQEQSMVETASMEVHVLSDSWQFA